MPQTYVREELYRIIIRKYPDKKPVEVINEAIVEKLKQEGHLEE